MSTRDLEGRLALVTGAGRGIGRAIAQALATAGSCVVVAARTPQEVEETAELICAAGGTAVPLILDVADYPSVAKATRHIRSQNGVVDILVNNAGIQGAIGPLESNDPAEWQRTINVNLVGTFNLCHALIPGMKELGHGKIINLSGGGATSPRASFSAYGASKAAIVRLTETLAVELADFDIQVNAIAPGAVNTRMLQEVIEAGSRAGDELADARRRREQGGTPPSLAGDLAVFLAGPRSDALTGALISAPHDDWSDWDERTLRELSASDWLTLRRIDPYTLRALDITGIPDRLAQLVPKRDKES